MPEIEIRDALNQAMCEEMRRDENVFLMGEEVAFYNGAYKVSKGMLDEFGERRVYDTPITECGFAGVGIGAAMVGLRPIIEMMTFNFALQAMDQIINHAAKISLMSGGQFHVPIVFRGPNGWAKNLGATHTQAFEATYSQFPGLKVVTYSNARDAKGLLKSAIRDDNPVIFLESEMTYGQKGEVPEGEYLIPLGVGDIKRPGKDITIVSWGKQINTALALAEKLAEEDIDAEVLDPRTLKPLDEELIFKSVRKTNRVVVIEETFRTCGMGADIADRIQYNCFDYLDAPVERVTLLEVPTPYAKALENVTLPSVERGYEAVKRAMYLN